MYKDTLVDIVRYNPAATTRSIVRTPIEAARSSFLPIGFAYPVHSVSRRPYPETMAYLRSAAETELRSETGDFDAATNRTYAYQLRYMHQALEVEGRPYGYLDDDVLDLVCDGMIHGLTERGAPFAESSIALCVGTILRCVDWTNDKGLSSIVVDREAALSRASGVDRLFDRDGAALERHAAGIIARRDMVRPLSKEHRALIEGALLLDPSRWTPDGPSSRPGLTYANGRRIGLRVSENLGIMAADVMAVTVVDPAQEYLFKIKRTKGADSRDVHVMGTDLKRWQAYFRNERAYCVKWARGVHGSNWDEPPQLIVNGIGAGVHMGEATQPGTIQSDFRDVLIGLGMATEVVGRDPQGAPVMRLVAWHCYHDLRHTAAWSFYALAKGLGEVDPIRYVQIRLGHKHRSTTDRIYLFTDARRVALVGDMTFNGVKRLARG